MPIRSMTASATAERATAWGALGCEMRSVNHRFLELGVRLPEELRGFESALRERVSARIGRGKIDLVLRLRAPAGASLGLDEAVVARLGELARTLDAHFPQMRVEFTELLQYPGVLQVAGIDAEALQAEALAVLDAALDAFVAAREREGGKLAEAIRERARRIEAIVADVRGLIPAIRTGQRQKLDARLADLGTTVDPGRLEQELVLWLQKLDVDEELDRLSSHLDELRRVLAQSGPAGRRLDFLLQEFNREANTIGSKAAALEMTNASIDLKLLVEQIREQTQNIE